MSFITYFCVLLSIVYRIQGHESQASFLSSYIIGYTTA